MSVRRIGLTIAVIPGVAMLALFYSLAIHMHHALGGWPASIGTRGFPRELVIHWAIAWYSFIVLLLSSFVSPIPILTCLYVERWRRFAVYPAVYATAVIFCFVVTQIAAPAQFLTWWRD